MIIDEAGRATLPELAICINKARRFILIGDHKQLYPIFEEDVKIDFAKLGFDEKDLKFTFFEEIYEKLREERPQYAHFLKWNYRMHSAISNIISKMFYNCEIESNSKIDLQKDHGLNFKEKVLWLSTEKLAEKTEKRDSTSYFNLLNSKIIKNLLSELNEKYKLKKDKRTVGIISPYLSQTKKLNSSIKPQSEEWTNIYIEIATVDAFQGSDVDIVIFDTVRSNTGNKLGHITDLNRLDVALSRGKQLLILIGDAFCAQNGKFPENQSNPYDELLQLFKTDTIQYKLKILEKDNEIL